MNTIEIFEQTMRGETATVKLQALYIEGTDRVIMNPEITVKLSIASGNWLINSITN
ncbi:MAG: hypothetical protein RIC03_07930 [Cyclobacteriaceae bacterium]